MPIDEGVYCLRCAEEVISLGWAKRQEAVASLAPSKARQEYLAAMRSQMAADAAGRFAPPQDPHDPEWSFVERVMLGAFVFLAMYLGWNYAWMVADWLSQ